MKKKTIFPALAVAFFLQLAATDLQAIPAFARKYSMTCKTCHTPFPKLKAYGDEFAANGYVIKDKDTPRYYIDTGDSLLSLLRDIPFALRLEGFLTYNHAHTKKVDFTSPYLIKLLSGGEITKHVSYFFYFFFSERGEVAGLEDAFVMFNNLFGPDLDFYVGQFQVSDPLFKRELRLPFEDYQIYSTKVGNSKADLTYDRGIMSTYRLSSGTSFCVELLNGSGLDPANVFENFDSDKYKNVLFRVSQDIGDQFRLGGFGYLGKERQEGDPTNSLRMLGADASLSLKTVQFNLQYVDRKDDNPYFAASNPAEVATRGAFAELVYLPKGDDSRWYGVGLFNWVDSDQDSLDYTSATLHYGRLLRRNIRATAEFSYIFTGPYGKHARVGLGLVTGF